METFVQTEMEREVWGAGENLLMQGNVFSLPREFRDLAGQVQLVYVDPPFMTGERFVRTRPIGAKGWKKGAPNLKQTAFVDQFSDEKEYLCFLDRLISESRELLRDTGFFALHLDWRMSARARLACDRIFGREQFLNEIIWSYESGGRSKKFFPRKHDTILLYAKSRKYTFDLTKVPLPRRTEGKKKNHMARGMDEDGRMYSSIVSGGKEYRYYDDEPVYPGDVWTDISHLQQRDPERTGYATQKPLKLLERLILPTTSEGDWVADLCCGSGTTAEAAQKLGRRFACLDLSPEAIAVSSVRLRAENLTVVCAGGNGPAKLLVEEDEDGFRLWGLEMDMSAFPEGTSREDVLEAWEAGAVEEGIFRPQYSFRRSFRYPELTTFLRSHPGSVQAVMTTDAFGARRAFVRR